MSIIDVRWIRVEEKYKKSCDRIKINLRWINRNWIKKWVRQVQQADKQIELISMWMTEVVRKILEKRKR